MPVLYYDIWDSPLGKILIGSNEEGLSHLTFLKDDLKRELLRLREKGEKVVRGSSQSNRESVKQLREYFQGKRQQFLLPMTLQGTPFQRKVWKALLRIPFGETRTYKQIAEEIGSRGYRAIGMACRTNRIGIVIPCHRVIASDGSPGGYTGESSEGGGVGLKEKLLSLERTGCRRAQTARRQKSR